MDSCFDKRRFYDGGPLARFVCIKINSHTYMHAYVQGQWAFISQRYIFLWQVINFTLGVDLPALHLWLIEFLKDFHVDDSIEWPTGLYSNHWLFSSLNKIIAKSSGILFPLLVVVLAHIVVNAPLRDVSIFFFTLREVEGGRRSSSWSTW